MAFSRSENKEILSTEGASHSVKLVAVHNTAVDQADVHNAPPLAKVVD
jgi:hypothetical protein